MQMFTKPDTGMALEKKCNTLFEFIICLKTSLSRHVRNYLKSFFDIFFNIKNFTPPFALNSAGWHRPAFIIS